MARRFNERQGPFGGKYWEDDDGNKIHERKGPLGGRYTEDTDGKKVEKRTGPLGGTYWEDSEGNKVEEMTGPFGGKYQVDSDGKKSSLRTGPLGGRWLDTESSTPAFPEESSTSKRSTASRGFSLPWLRPPTFTDDGPTQGIIFLIGLVLVLAVIFLFLYIGLPILFGVLLAKLVNRRWIQPLPERQRWRWIILPAVFAAGALPTNELVATGIGALNCSDNQSSSCARYRLSPTPTILGLHRWLTQREINSNISPQPSISDIKSPGLNSSPSEPNTTQGVPTGKENHAIPMTNTVNVALLPNAISIYTPIGLKCLDAAAETWTQERGMLQIYPCNGSPNQQWNLSQNRLLISTPSGVKCLDAAAETWTQERGTLQIYPCNGSPNQQWNLSQNRLLISTPSGVKCLDAAAETWSQERGTLQIYPCNGSPNQRWNLRYRGSA